MKRPSKRTQIDAACYTLVALIFLSILAPWFL